MSNPNMIAVNQLSFRYRRQAEAALRDIDMTIAAGSIVAITGAAGSGKSTLCALLAGFMPQFFRGEVQGTAIVDGVSPLEQSILQMLAHVTIVTSQASTQISGVCDRVIDEVGFGLQNLAFPASEIHQRVAHALELMGISHLSERAPLALSGGQQQRVVIAAALAMRPPVLILDEPTAQLDPPAVQQLGLTLQALARQGQTIVVAEHHLDWVAEYAERVITLDAGRIVADGTPAQVFGTSRAAGRPSALRLSHVLQTQGVWQAPHLATTRTELFAGITPTSTRPVEHQARPTVPLPAEQAVLHIEDVAFAYGDVHVLDAIQLTVHAGERVALLGQNGAGKSTLLRHFNGLLRPRHGRVMLKGQDIATWPPGLSARIASIVFQDVRNQLFASTIHNEIAFGPTLLKLRPDEITRRVDYALQLCGLTDIRDVHPYDIPPARRRLVATAAILALHSDLVALDEPTAGMDEAGIAQLSHALAHVHADGKSIVIVSHDLNFCVTHTDRVVLLKSGQVVLDTQWRDLTLAQLTLLDQEVGLPIGHDCCLHLGIEPSSPLGRQLTDPAALH